MKVLLKVITGLVAEQLPDDSSLFKNQDIVAIDGEQYLYADYIGSKQLVSDYNVEDYLTSVEEAKPKAPAVVTLTNVNVTGEHVVLGSGDIWWLPKNSPFTLTANAQLPNAQMMIIVERVINGGVVVDDLRIKASIENGIITVNGLFAMSGNYQITSDRLNKGLETIDAPFRLAFEKVEFDAHV